MQRTCLVITGPTGVGKTDCVEHIASAFPIEVVNADIGQMYTPLTIGTAKPDWRNASVPHHLFDIFDAPHDCSVRMYRDMVMERIRGIWERKAIPAIVGGSLFYIKSLFFPPVYTPNVPREMEFSVGDDQLWSQLYGIDPERARAIHPHDTYRLKRALTIWYATGTKPSAFVPQFDAPSDTATLVCLTRDRSELYERINTRVHRMLASGWIQEVSDLDDAWRDFVCHKGVIGYPEIVTYLDGDISYDAMVSRIQDRTRAYAKRQLAFWRSLRRTLSTAFAQHAYQGDVMELSLSDASYKSCSQTIMRAMEHTA